MNDSINQGEWSARPQKERYPTIDAKLTAADSPLKLVMSRKAERGWTITFEVTEGPTKGINVHEISDDEASQGITIESDERPFSLRW